jgi:ergothioneine biosynthesis protein EgtB
MGGVSLSGMVLAKQQTEQSFADVFSALRDSTTGLCATLSPEDCNLQAMPETSPAKWHLAHTTWFFETFVLAEYCAGYQTIEPLYSVLFNSYYNAVGEQFPRPQRALLSRPSLEEVLEYRAVIDAAVIELLNDSAHPQANAVYDRVELGLHHEAQHQELLLTDLKYSLFQNPLLPAYRELQITPAVVSAAPLHFVELAGGQIETGYQGDGFCFDNELPRHTEYVAPFRLADRLVSNGDFLDFVEDGGYTTPEHWLADGWNEVQQQQWSQPLYWGRVDGQWLEYTLHGLQQLDESAPVAHLSYFEAQAYAAWAGHRLPTEAEWECAAQSLQPLAQSKLSQAQLINGNLVEADHLHPQAATDGQGTAIKQLFGDCWEWTNSAYLPYPGYQPLSGAVGEYNGKFMSGQMVLRGGSCLSRTFHIRASYRNFFYPQARWQCAGIRLAADC